MNRENIKNLILLTFLVSFFIIQISDLKAASVSSGKGYANATVVTRQIKIDDANQSSSYEINSTETVGRDKNSKLTITYSIVSEPNSILNVYYRTGDQGSFIGSQQDMVIEPRNSSGDKIKLILKTGDGKVYFDQNGKGVLNVAPEVGITGNQLQGTYRATYEVVVSY